MNHKSQIPPSNGVRSYYEQNSAWFRLVGKHRQSLAIHRPVWADGIDDRPSALNYVNERIRKQAEDHLARWPVERIHLLDLGCGFGGTIHYLVHQLGSKISAVGITISAQQAQLTHQWVNALGAEDRSTFIEADFHAVPLVESMDIACSVEAFAHARHPEHYFAEAARLLKPGGRLILCDDFQSNGKAAQALTPTEQRWLKIFKDGWRVPHLLSTGQVATLAEKYQLVKIEESDLNPHLRMRTFSNKLLPLFEQAIQPRGRFSTLLGSVVGGWALEHCIRRGNVTYRFLVFEKAANECSSRPT